MKIFIEENIMEEIEKIEIIQFQDQDLDLAQKEALLEEEIDQEVEV